LVAFAFATESVRVAVATRSADGAPTAGVPAVDHAQHATGVGVDHILATSGSVTVGVAIDYDSEDDTVRGDYRTRPDGHEALLCQFFHSRTSRPHRPPRSRRWAAALLGR
jgi:hypothetical protein